MKWGLVALGILGIGLSCADFSLLFFLDFFDTSVLMFVLSFIINLCSLIAYISFFVSAKAVSKPRVPVLIVTIVFALARLVLYFCNCSIIFIAIGGIIFSIVPLFFKREG